MNRHFSWIAAPRSRPLEADWPRHWEAVALAAMLLGCAAWAPAWVWLLAGAPLVEEVIFRAGLQAALIDRLNAHGDVWRLTATAQAAAANLATALLFAAAHWARHPGVPSLLTALPALLLGALYQRSRDWRACAALHALFNGLWLLALRLTSLLEINPAWMS